LAALQRGESSARPAADSPESIEVDTLWSQERAAALIGAESEKPLRPEDELDAPLQPETQGRLVLTQDELDAVLAGGNAEDSLNETGLDDVISVRPLGPDPDRLLVSPLTEVPADAQAAEVAGDLTPEMTGADLLQADLTSLFADSTRKVSAAESDTGSGTHAGDGPDAEAVGVSQDLLDALLAEAEGTKPPAPASPKASPSSVAAPAPSPRSEPAAAMATASKRYRARFFAAAAAAVIVGGGTYLYLSSHPLRTPQDLRGLETTSIRPLAHAVRVANAYIEEGDYARALAELEAPLTHARPSQERTAAEYVYTEAAFRALPADAPDQTLDQLHDRIDMLVQGARSHPRAAEALVWKAELYQRQRLPSAATAVYREIIRNYGLAPNLDDVLYDAAANALSMEDYETGAGYLQRLLTDHPGSRLAGPAKLLLGDAYNGAGQRDSARVIYIQIAEANATVPLGAEAYARLGTLAHDEGRYQDAITLLETRRQMATTLQGNEQVYLTLAKAYRGAQNPAEAEVVLRELIDFFPENPYTPEAYVELSQVLEERGFRQEALRLARRAATTYPRIPLVLRNHGEITGHAGFHAEAAEAFIAAEAAGAKDPGVLLRAAGHFHKTQNLPRAVAAYEQVLVHYATRPEALEAGIALAKLDYEQNRLSKAIERLENLATVTQGRPHRVPVLTTLAGLYAGLGMDQRAGQIYGQIAAVTSDPELLAQAATALLRAGHLDEGLRVAARVERSKVSPEKAYALLMQQGLTLLRADPERGLGLMEEAYASYPESHDAGWGQRLLEAYLTSDRSAYARRLVMDLHAKAQHDPSHLPDLVRAAVTWGDFLYDRQDYRAAADAYALIPADRAATFPEGDWALFQRANALLQISDFEGSIRLFDAIAAGKGPWAREAATKAKYARVEQRLRGMPVTPPEGAARTGAAA
jgi:tetratricopeptide (TPR) repeat protein